MCTAYWYNYTVQNVCMYKCLAQTNPNLQVNRKLQNTYMTHWPYPAGKMVTYTPQCKSTTYTNVWSRTLFDDQLPSYTCNNTVTHILWCAYTSSCAQNSCVDCLPLAGTECYSTYKGWDKHCTVVFSLMCNCTQCKVQLIGKPESKPVDTKSVGPPGKDANTTPEHSYVGQSGSMWLLQQANRHGWPQPTIPKTNPAKCLYRASPC